jgi:hypothetical protein
MANEELLTQIRSRQAAHLRACFPTLAERDLLQIVGSRPQHAVYVLQQSFGCDVEDAKAAWNDFVLRYLDGPGYIEPAQRGQLPPSGRLF